MAAYWNVLSMQVIPNESYRVLYAFQKYGITGIKNNFSIDRLIDPIPLWFSFFLFKFFGTSNAWIITSVLLHIINSFLVFLSSEKVLGIFSKNNYHSTTIAFFAAAMFLLSPYQTEAVLYTPREINYLLATMFSLFSVLFMANYFETPSLRNLVLLHAGFILAILSYETPLPFPAISFLFYIALLKTGKTIITKQNYLKKILAPQLCILTGYFILCKAWFGDWILHYGAAAHLKLSPVIITNVLAYLAKFLVFYRYLPASRHNLFHDIFHLDVHQPATIIVLSVLGILCIVAVFKYLSKKKEETWLMFFLCAGFIVWLIPVINLETTFLGAIESDRYGYLPSVFFYFLLTYIIFQFFGKLRYIAATAWIIVSWILLSQTTVVWKETSQYCHKLIANFEPYVSSEKRLYILNMPHNYNWVFAFNEGFAEGNFFKYGTWIGNRLNTVAYCPVSSSSDSMEVTAVSEKEIIVKSANKDRRFLYGGKWNSSYQTADYKVDFNEQTSSYRLTFLNAPNNADILYLAGEKWKRVAMF